ncbi:MAG: alpha-glucosidase [Liquorilactobacillus nagelii]|jgi:oligo-1,6-glucosidase|uniref:Glucohydrolase n=2 Tax=Lactobacillaceae TaxID=33958 RepID=A0A3S6R215_9LACO|nr:alpha-glucosidase [Liquorilactobacillus nagelii]AUJ32627.1 glucohydrolase [Liquorilactobacillus nagelii]KRL42414.1 trehalose-6-phosphate hydrolase [Liquorilactobacillus nagelii DSM 13675]MCC7616784.1 alpha-glucosidase [Liquorilactobacillus nagelii]MCP9315699.1 alpha-glucosidase [Liquorilactobacillus nagelii]QYH53265.1 alpha-glucosidase [Liquorilactobacillus nagelii DSM 13675]
MKKKWWQKAVVYQVYPRSFQDSDGDGIGDLGGVLQRLPYIKKLGVDVIWLNPIYKSPDKDNGYDISDYRAIQPKFGNMKVFDQLLAETHRLGMKIVMDLVVNHTSDQHEWFKQSRSSKDNPYRDFYIWRDGKNNLVPNNWGSYFGGSTWQFDEATKQYYLHLFAKGQPDLNWENPAVREQVWELMRFWLNKGVDGFRMDVINFLSKPAGLPDAPNPEHAEFANVEPMVADGPKLNDYLREMNKKVLSHYDVMSVGEMPSAKPKDALEYTGLDAHELNMVFQFDHVTLALNKDPRLGKWNDQPVKLVDLKQALSKWQTALDGKGWNSLYWNNHDRARAVSRFGNDSPQYRVLSAKMLATTLHMMQGTPYIYQGEELGMTNAHFTALSEYQDIESIEAYHQLVEREKLVDHKTMMRYLATESRDNARTPMQWDTSTNAGFTSGKPWLQLNKNYCEINAAAELKDQQSVFYYYQKLIKLRHQSDLIVYGNYQELIPEDEEVFAYRREYQGQTLVVISNFTEKIIKRHLEMPTNKKLLISNYADDQADQLRPFEAKVYLY